MNAMLNDDDRIEALKQIIQTDDQLMQVMRMVRHLQLPQWVLFSGAVYQGVWNHMTGRPVGFGIKDYDIGYFDPDTSWDAEDVWIKRVADAFEEPLKTQVEVRNQARVHLWAPQKFGEDFAPLTCTEDAPVRFVAPAFAVGARLEEDDSLTIIAPYGLADVFDMVLRPNPTRGKAKGWDAIIAKLQARWPELTVSED